MTGLISSLADLRNYYNSHVTKPFSFRKQQLKLLKQTLFKYDKEIEQALFADLKKNREETYATETGLVLAEINVTLKNLREWMEPKSAGTNLVNLPSTSKIYRDPLGVCPHHSSMELSCAVVIDPISWRYCRRELCSIETF